MNILITGGTGFIGSYLSKICISRGYSISIVSRNPEKAKKILPSGIIIYQNIDSIPTSVVFDIIINLAGEPLMGKRWNHDVKQRCLRSRIDTTDALCKLINRLEYKPAHFISCSAVGYYGDCGERKVTEESPVGNDFASVLCKQWEETALKASSKSTKVTLIRVGVVLGKNAGALKKMLPPFKLGLGGQLGNGEQFFPWVHIDDVMGMIFYIIDHSISGPVNLVGPTPITNREFTFALGKTLSRPTVFPVPAFILRLLFGEGSVMLLGGQKVYPEKLERYGYIFKYRTINSALEDIIV